MTNNILLMVLPTGGEMIVLLIIIFVLFGGKKIPELARGIGKGIRDFNEAKTGPATEADSNLKHNDK